MQKTVFFLQKYCPFNFWFIIFVKTLVGVMAPICKSTVYTFYANTTDINLHYYCIFESILKLFSAKI